MQRVVGTISYTDHYIPFLDRVNAPVPLQGPHTTPDLPDESDVHTPILPERSIFTQLENQSTTLPSDIDDTTEENINTYNQPYDDENGSPMYWLSANSLLVNSTLI